MNDLFVLIKESCFVKELSFRLILKMGKDLVCGMGGRRLFGEFKVVWLKLGK